MSQLDLLTAPNTAARVYALPDADVSLEPFLADEAALRLFESLRERIEWRQDTVRIFGRAHPIPRLHQWFAEPGMAYSWSGIRMEPRPWIPALSELRERLRAWRESRRDEVLQNRQVEG